MRFFQNWFRPETEQERLAKIAAGVQRLIDDTEKETHKLMKKLEETQRKMS